MRTEELLLNMGPQHPSTHGVLKVILELEGERLVKSTPVMGFLHRGVEKLAEEGTYHQFIPHTDRLDYVCAMYNNFAYCRAVEKLMNITVPDRAEYLRTIVAEVQRIIGHQFWLGTQALDIGAMTVFFYCFRDREILLDWFDELCGARLTTSWYRIGGVERDFTPSLFAKLKQFLDYFPPKIDEYVVFLEKNRIWIARTKGVAVISAEDAVEFRAERTDASRFRSGLRLAEDGTVLGLSRSANSVFRSGRTAIPTTGTGSASWSCTKASRSSSSASNRFRTARSWPTCPA